MKRRTLLLGAFAAIACAPAISRADDGVSLKRTVKVGEVEKYKTTFDIDGVRAPDGTMRKLRLAITTTDTVRKVEADGGYEVIMAIDSATIQAEGAEIPLPSSRGQTATASVDKSGRIIKAESTSEQGKNLAMLLGLTRITFSAQQPLKQGEEVKFDETYGDNGKYKVKGTVTLVGSEKPSGDVKVDTVKVHSVSDLTVQGQNGEEKASLDTTSLVDPKTGQTQRVEGTVKGTALKAIGPDAKVSFTRILQK